MKYQINYRHSADYHYVNDDTSADALETFMRKQSIKSKMYRPSSVFVAKIGVDDEIPEWIKGVYFIFEHDRNLVNWEFYIIVHQDNDTAEAYAWDNSDGYSKSPLIAEAKSYKKNNK